MPCRTRSQRPRIVEPFVEIRQQRGRAFDTDEVDELEVGGADLGRQLARTVGEAVERSGKQRTQLAGALDVWELLDHALDVTVELPDQDAVDAGRPPRDRGDEDWTAWSHDSASLEQGLQTIRPARQVVERPEQEDGIDRGACQVDGQCIADGRVGPIEAGQRVRGLLDMQRHEVAVMHAVAERGKPCAVAPGPAADVGDHARRSRQVAGDDLLRPGELQRAGAAVEPVALLAQLVVGVQRRTLVGSHTKV